jgi:hypothetical protein
MILPCTSGHGSARSARVATSSMAVRLSGRDISLRRFSRGYAEAPATRGLTLIWDAVGQ